MLRDDYELLKVEREGRAAWVTIDNPPINLLTVPLMIELLKLGAAANDDPELLVLVIQSADPDFFIAHFDVEVLVDGAGAGEPNRRDDLNDFGVMCEMFRTMPAVTMCKIAGRIGGGGSELAMACDMRFGARGKAVMNQMEVPIGILPGGGGTQRLPDLIGRARAAELILGGLDLDADTGERWGYFNRSLPPDELDAHVDGLARRIASFPPHAVRLAKESLRNARPDPVPGLVEESWLFARLMATDDARVGMSEFLARGGQTREDELRVAELSGEVASAHDW